MISLKLRLITSLERQIRAQVAEEVAREIEKDACDAGTHCGSAYCAQARIDAALARSAGQNLPPRGGFLPPPAC